MDDKIKIDLGCGPNKKEGFIGIDRILFPGVDYHCYLGVDPLPFEDETVDEAHASHFLEHLTAIERVQLINELYRILKPGCQATIIIPSWSSSRAYGDPTHQWPPISEFWFCYLDKKWRDENAPHTDKNNWDVGYDCDFEHTLSYTMHPMLFTRNQEFQGFATTFYKEAVQDIHCTITKKSS